MREIRTPGSVRGAARKGRPYRINHGASRHLPSGAPCATTRYGLPNGAASADIYVADATLASPGTLLVAGADIQGACANCGSTNQSYIFYVTKDKSHLFYSFSQVTVGDGGAAVVAPTDGVYCVAIP